jgi:hypothetical protein
MLSNSCRLIYRSVICFIISIFLLLVLNLPAFAVPDDLSQLSFSDLPAINNNGSIDLEDSSRQWATGQTPDQFLRLGDIQSLLPQSLSIETISEALGQDSSGTSIGDFAPLATQSVGSLLKAMPELSQLSIDDIPVLQALFSEKASLNPSQLQGTQLNQLLQDYPELSQLNLDDIDLSQFSIDSLPGADKLPISKLDGWEKATLKEVPGLNKLPMGSFPGAPLLAGGGIMRVDFVHGPEEAERTNTISGSDVMGFRVPCTIGNPDDCAYIELDDAENVGRSVQSPLEGVQWISGKYQEVEGGHGAYKWVNNGKEPTGRLPFGDTFKVVVWEPDEVTDSVTTALFARYCDDWGCTPYFIGPIPFMTYHRDDPIFVGLITPEPPTLESSTPTRAKKGGGFPPMTTFDSSILGGGRGGDGRTCTVDPSKLDGATKAAIASVDSASREGAMNMVPYIMNACTEAGVTDSDQLAYIIATAQHETDHFRTMQEYSRTMYDECGWGEGMVQVTWCGNKERVFRELGLPAYGGMNDHRLQQPEVAAQALCRGMKEGWYGQGRPIAECIGGGRVDYRCARAQVNGTDRWEEIGAAADRIKSGLAGSGGATGNNAVVCQSSTGSGGAGGSSSGGAVTAGSVNDRIRQSATNLEGKIDTSSLGRNGCVLAVNEVMEGAGMQPFSGLSVVNIVQDCQAGRCTEVSAAQAQPGDIVVVDDGVSRGHTGICLSSGCTETLSNSSSSQNLTWRSDGWFSESYGNTGAFRRYIFRVNR